MARIARKSTNRYTSLSKTVDCRPVRDIQAHVGRYTTVHHTTPCHSPQPNTNSKGSSNISSISILSCLCNRPTDLSHPLRSLFKPSMPEPDQTPKCPEYASHLHPKRSQRENPKKSRRAQNAAHAHAVSTFTHSPFPPSSIGPGPLFTHVLTTWAPAPQTR